MHIDPSFWIPVPISASDALAAMHRLVFSQAADKKVRSPRWTFELDSDLAVQLQARMNGPVTWFEGRLLSAPGASRQMLLASRQPRGVWRASFRISVIDGQWALKFTSFGWPRDATGQTVKVLELRDRLRAAFARGAFEDLGNYGRATHCIVCGKPMSDAVSMARRIGPECWGNAQVTLPFFFQAEATS
jgi:Family of unknown function (DUF6011)